MTTNPISTTIDFDKEGLQHGFLKLPHSRDDSAWGAIMTPITVMKNGNGPTALITGANHGDEYEGPMALFNFAGRTDLSDIHGRVIVIPAMNYPAFTVSRRVSPIDNINLNRCFPGKPNGSVTEIIADYFTNTMVPMADYVLDIHSGGKTLDFLPFAAIHKQENKEYEARCETFMKAFGAPYCCKMLDLDAYGMYDTMVEQTGKIFVTTELGGGGTTTPYTMKIAKRGVDNFLIQAGILDGKLTPCRQEQLTLDMPDESSYLLSLHNGLIDPYVTLGDHVKKGDLMARIHIVERTAVPPFEYYAPRDGIVMSRHVPSRVSIGDSINVIAAVHK
ncbi:MAG: N(2)-acetyl-L-2,4-diaminobutanoate deacetylase DoeB [Thermodesulfobacteriota bacterium]